MHRFAIVMSIAALVACGSSESTPSGADAGDAPPVSAPAPMEKAAPAAEAAAAPAAAESTDVVVTEIVGCIDLVGAGRYGEAVPVCAEELRVDPENAEIQSALAKAEAARMGGDAAAAEAAGQASSALEGATDKIPSVPGIPSE